MDLLQTVRKEGSRGGVNFSWDDVKSSSHRENYLGHSLMAPVGRWQKGKDLSWYAKAEDADLTPEQLVEKERLELELEKRKIKEAEEDAMAKALGLPVPDRTAANLEPLGMSRAQQGAVNRALKETLGNDDGSKGGANGTTWLKKDGTGDIDRGQDHAREAIDTDMVTDTGSGRGQDPGTDSLMGAEIRVQTTDVTDAAEAVKSGRGQDPGTDSLMGAEIRVQTTDVTDAAGAVKSGRGQDPGTDSLIGAEIRVQATDGTDAAKAMKSGPGVAMMSDTGSGRGQDPGIDSLMGAEIRVQTTDATDAAEAVKSDPGVAVASEEREKADRGQGAPTEESDDMTVDDVICRRLGETPLNETIILHNSHGCDRVPVTLAR